jgi:hypothetical protein
MAEPACEQRAADPEKHGDNASARVAARHQQLRKGPSKAADDNPADDSIMFHWGCPFPSLPSRRNSFSRFNQPSLEPCNAHLAKWVPPLVETG